MTVKECLIGIGNLNMIEAVDERHRAYTSFLKLFSRTFPMWEREEKNDFVKGFMSAFNMDINDTDMVNIIVSIFGNVKNYITIPNLICKKHTFFNECEKLLAAIKLYEITPDTAHQYRFYTDGLNIKYAVWGFNFENIRAHQVETYLSSLTTKIINRDFLKSTPYSSPLFRICTDTPDLNGEIYFTNPLNVYALKPNFTPIPKMWLTLLDEFETYLPTVLNEIRDSGLESGIKEFLQLKRTNTITETQQLMMLYKLRNPQLYSNEWLRILIPEIGWVRFKEDDLYSRNLKIYYVDSSVSPYDEKRSTIELDSPLFKVIYDQLLRQCR